MESSLSLLLGLFGISTVGSSLVVLTDLILSILLTYFLAIIVSLLDSRGLSPIRQTPSVVRPTFYSVRPTPSAVGETSFEASPLAESAVA